MFIYVQVKSDGKMFYYKKIKLSGGGDIHL